MSKDAKNVPALRFKGYSDAWEKRKLGEVATITMGQSPDSKNYTLNPQDHILVQGNADIKNGWVEPRVWTTQITKIAKKGSVLLSVRAPVGEVSKTAFDVVLGRGVASVGQTDFLYQYLITLKISGFWLRYSTGSTFDSINSSDIKEAIIFLPKKNEQDRIAKTLNCIDNLIAATQDKIDALEQAKKALLQRLFDQSWRFKGYSDPWEKRKLNYFLHVNEIKNKSEIYSKKDVLSVSGEFGIVNQIELQGRSFAGSSVKNYGVVELGDVVYTKSPLKKNPFGIVKVNRNKAGIVSTLYAIYKPQTTLYSPIIDYYFQSDCRVNNYLKPLVNKGAKNDMKVKNVDVLKGNVTIPSEIDEQRTIVGLLNKLDKLIAATQSRLSSLELLKKYLLQDLFI